MDADLGERVKRKIAVRTVPLLAIIFLISYLDRVNIGFAALTMNQDLGITATQYGWVGAIFFIGYVLFQIPSNLALARLGARVWMPIISCGWGIASMSMSMVTDAQGLMIARFLLGVAEAGFVPGTVLYLTLWFPPAYRGRIIAGFFFANPIASVVGAPVSGIILNSLDGWMDIAGWQWLFLIEGFPALLGAAAIFWLLPSEPKNVKWLDEEERGWLLRELHAANTAAQSSAQRTVLGTMLDARVLTFSLVYFGLATGIVGIGLWLPLIIKESGTTPLVTGFLTAIPYLCAALIMLALGRLADRGGQGAKYTYWPLLIGAVSLVVAAYAETLEMRLLFLTITTIGVVAPMPPFWAHVSKPLAALLPAVGIAMINCTGNLGGFVGPLMIGFIRDKTQSFQLGLVAVAACVAVGGIAMMLVPGERKITPGLAPVPAK